MDQTIIAPGSVISESKKNRNSTLKIRLVGFYDGLYFIGLRKLSAYTKLFYKDVGVYFYNVNGYGAFLRNFLFESKRDDLFINPDLLKTVADADVIGVSCLSNYSCLTEEFIRQVRKINPSCFIVWGGAHAKMDPGNCIPVADAVCTSEGQKAFIELLDNLHTPQLKDIQGFWFRFGTEIVKNKSRPLMTSEELTELPYLDYSENIMYVNKTTLCKLDSDIYLHEQGPSTINLWSLGCPFKCSYCGNTAFLNDDKNFAQLRYPTPEYIVGELKHILNRFGFINYIGLNDDNFFLIQNKDLIEFAKLYKKEIGLPFHVLVFPGTVRDESTLDLLIDAGLSRTHMGIQSGGQRMMNFYGRKTSRRKVIDTANLLISKYPKISPPEFDFVIDNPVEDDHDKKETIDLMESLNAPYIPLIYSLKTIPGTNLYAYATEHPEIPFVTMGKSYRIVLDNAHSLRVYIYGLGKPSKSLKRFVEFVGNYPMPLLITLRLVILLTLGRRLYYDIKTGNMSTLLAGFPRLAIFIYKWGLLRCFKSYRRRPNWSMAKANPALESNVETPYASVSERVKSES